MPNPLFSNGFGGFTDPIAGQSFSSGSFGSGLGAMASGLLSGGLGFLGNALGSVSGGLFSANQARKNRKFQERMYNKQVEDTERFWNMTNEYNSPSAVLQRIEDAGLNPMLYYSGSGAQGNVATSPPSLPSAPHGAQGNVGSFNTAIDLANLRLLEAQSKDLEASANLKNTNAAESGTHIDWYERTKELDYAMKERNYDKMSYEIHQIATSTNSLADLTWKQLETMSKSIEMMDKHYDLSDRELQARTGYWLSDIAVRNRSVDATLKDIAVKAYNAVTSRKLALSTINKNAYEVQKIIADTNMSKQQKQTELQKTVNQFFHNIGYATFGAENVNSGVAGLLLLTGAASGRTEFNEEDLKNYMNIFDVEY